MNESMSRLALQHPTIVEAVHSASASYFLGMSLMSNRRFSKRSVGGLADRLAPSPLILLIADSLEIYNYRGLRGCGRREARMRSKRAGLTYFVGFSRLAEQKRNLFPILTSELDSLDVVAAMRASTKAEYSENAEFRRAVQAEVIANLGNRVRHLLSHVRRPGPLECYVIHEIAIVLALQELVTKSALVQLSFSEHSILRDLDRQVSLLQRTGMTSHSLLYQVIESEPESGRAAA